MLANSRILKHLCVSTIYRRRTELKGLTFKDVERESEVGHETTNECWGRGEKIAKSIKKRKTFLDGLFPSSKSLLIGLKHKIQAQPVILFTGDQEDHSLDKKLTETPSEPVSWA
jgi:hypothetical protein